MRQRVQIVRCCGQARDWRRSLNVLGGQGCNVSVVKLAHGSYSGLQSGRFKEDLVHASHFACADQANTAEPDSRLTLPCNRHARRHVRLDRPLAQRQRLSRWPVTRQALTVRSPSCAADLAKLVCALSAGEKERQCHPMKGLGLLEMRGVPAALNDL